MNEFEYGKAYPAPTGWVVESVLPANGLGDDDFEFIFQMKYFKKSRNPGLQNTDHELFIPTTD